MRPLVSYDDITPPYEVNATSSLRSSRPPPSKKQKWAHPKSKQSQQGPSNTTNNVNNRHTTASTIPAQPETAGRELTYDEIWDDSALIDAWNAATEEYEAYNGPEKGWKEEPVHKSPL